MSSMLAILLAGLSGASPKTPAAVEWLGPPAPVDARRVVSLAPSLTEIAFAVGRGDRVAGVTRFDETPAQVRTLPRVGGFVDPDPEAVLALRPDLVLAAPVPGARERLDTLARLGVPVVVVPAETLDDLWTAIEVVSSRLGAADAGRRLAGELRGALSRARERTRDAAPVQAAIVVGYRPMIAAGPGSFLDTLLAALHATNVVRGAAFTHLDLEALAAAAPDVVVDLTMGERTPEGLWERVASLTAPHSPRVVRLEDDALLRPGPRLPQALRRLDRALRPPP